MTSVELPLWQFLSGLFGLIAFFTIALAFTVRVIITMFTKRLDERHSDIKTTLDSSVSALKETLTGMEKRTDERFDRISDDTRRLERDLLQLKADLPNQYERRDDAVRREVAVISRLESLRHDLRERTA